MSDSIQPLQDSADPNAGTVNVPVSDRPLLYEQASRMIAYAFMRLKGMNTIPTMFVSEIMTLFSVLKGRVPAESAHEIAKRYADIPKYLRTIRAHADAGTLEEILDDLANRPPDKILVDTVFGDLQLGDRWRGEDGFERLVLQEMRNGFPLRMSVALEGPDAFEIQQPSLPRLVKKIVRT